MGKTVTCDCAVIYWKVLWENSGGFIFFSSGILTLGLMDRCVMADVRSGKDKAWKVYPKHGRCCIKHHRAGRITPLVRQREAPFVFQNER